MQNYGLKDGIDFKNENNKNIREPLQFETENICDFTIV